MLTINKTTDGENVTVSLEGRFDAGSVSQLEAELEGTLKHAKTLVFDLQGLESITTAGLRVLLSAQKQMNGRGRMRLVNVGDAVMQTMELRGLSDIFNVSEPE